MKSKVLGILVAGLITQIAIAAPRPNILLIMADDLGIEVMGSYGGTSYKTPTIDRLASQGMRFTNAFSTPKCSPSRVTILTGRYTFRTTLTWGHIPSRELTFGAILETAGYKTALAGKWQLGRMKDEPARVQKAGFGNNVVWAWREGPRYWSPMIYHNGRRQVHSDRYGPDVFTDALIAFMEVNKDAPFLAYYPMVLPHWPKDSEPMGPKGRRETFAESVSAMDRQVGKLVAALERLNLRERTLILFTADNGTSTDVTSYLDGRRIVGGKGSMLDEGTRVPLIANWPGTTPSAAVNHDLIDLTDFLPTLAELAGAKLPADRIIDGVSFAAALKGITGETRKWVFTEFGKKRWIRDRRWKLYGNGKFYDMKADVQEKSTLNNLSPEEADAKNQLQVALEALLTRARP